VSCESSNNLVRPVGSWVAVVTPLTADDCVDIDGHARRQKQLSNAQGAYLTSTRR
jgi:dihydrodipicolinate synthase/N-acetylneuraminate lyase